MSATALTLVQTNGSAEASTYRWAAVVTHPRAEQWAVANLAQTGYETYLPLYASRERHPRLRWIWRVVHKPLFPRYAFLRHAEGQPLIPVWHTPGVRALIVNAERKPQYARNGAVEALQATEPFRRSPLPPGAEWAPGDACSLAAGVFKGQPAAVSAIEDEIAEVSVIMLGELRSVRVPVECLIPRDS